MAPPVLGWIADLIAHPLVERILLPIFGKWLAGWLERQAEKLKVKMAVKAAKTAKTVEDLREASRKLTDASNRSGNGS